MMGLMIPVWNDHELQQHQRKQPGITERVLRVYTFIRLNGLQLLFHDWVYKNFPDRAGQDSYMIEQSCMTERSTIPLSAQDAGEGRFRPDYRAAIPEIWQASMA